VGSRNCVVFSYTWYSPATGEMNLQLQAWLRQLRVDLQHAGIMAQLDVTRLGGHIEGYMSEGIRQSDVVLVIGTPRLKERWAQGPNNLTFELNQIPLKKRYGIKMKGHMAMLSLVRFSVGV
jgi:hypothetical protein